MLLKKYQIQTPTKTLKTYTLLGIPLLQKEKSAIKRKYTLCGLKFCLTRKHPLIPAPANNINDFTSANFAPLKQNLPDINTFKAIISNPNIKVISFDVFDTLLLRPAINPTDIFYLAAAKLKQTINADFIKYRLSAEQELNNPFATIDDIYNHIQTKYHLSDSLITQMKTEELTVEQRLLSRREDIYELYQHALNCKKRVIAVSDMYLPATFIAQTLREKGYKNIAKVYVSNEYQNRKDNGSLYPVVLKSENISASQLLHIGDNKNADQTQAIKHHITALHYPSIREILSNQQKIFAHIWPSEISNDPIARIILGWCLNHHFANMNTRSDQPAVFENLSALATLSLAPLLFHITQSIGYTPAIQQNYNRILFASRDGWLPLKGYELLRRQNPNILPAKYIYAGRRAYFSAAISDFTSYAKHLDVDTSSPYTLENLFDAYISDDKIKKHIMQNLSPKEKNLDLNTQKPEFLKVLHRHQKQLTAYLKTHHQNAAAYYASFSTSENKRELVFDCGYSGSVSTALTQLLNTPTDKIYLWETKQNKLLDKKNKTKTFTLMNEPQLFIGQNIICEELFSPLEGGCIGFDAHGNPQFEKCEISPQMRNTLTKVQTETLNTLENMFTDFAPWLEYMHISDTAALQKPLAMAVTQSPYNETVIFKDIIFPDPSYITAPESLTNKIEKNLRYPNPFALTGFNNPANAIQPPKPNTPQQFRLGIHCHLYNVALAEEILYYIQSFPAPFDLILTTCHHQNHAVLQNIFTPESVPNLRRLIVKTVENRGRDVAPWLIATNDIQQQYDLFCHIHGKESKHFYFGETWRQYLYKNIISPEAVANILTLFEHHPKLGLLFPAPYPTLKQFCITHNINQRGMFGEEKITNQLLKQLSITEKINNSNIIFSEGTMMWYRPNALKRLFELNLKTTDFPPEPIGVGGTIAHAIERLPAIVCHAEGYQAKTFTLPQ